MLLPCALAIDWRVNKLFLLFVFLCSTILSSCWWKGGDDSSPKDFFVKVDRSSSAIEVELPTALWDELEEIGAIIYTNVEGQKVKYYTDKTFLPFFVRLHEKSDRVLGGNQFQVKMGEGGGHLNLGEFVTGKKGQFLLEVNVPEKFSWDNIYVFFLSNARRKSIGEDIVGAGWGCWLQIRKHQFFLHSYIKNI